MSDEYELGYQLLHLRSRKLFTVKTLEERLILSEQALESWLLRVASARWWADLEPGQVQRELAELARQEQRQQRRAAVRRNQEHMQQIMVRWLQGDHQDYHKTRTLFLMSKLFLQLNITLVAFSR